MALRGQGSLDRKDAGECRRVYASMIESRKRTNPEEFARRWCATVAAARSWLPAYYELRYERLVWSPEEEVRKVLAFLGEPFEAQVAAFSGRPEDFDRVHKATGKESPTLRRLAEPITTAGVGVWSKRLIGRLGMPLARVTSGTAGARLSRWRGLRPLYATMPDSIGLIADEIEHFADEIENSFRRSAREPEKGDALREALRSRT